MSLHSSPDKINTVILDIDGVMTDGRIGYGNGSDQELKFFDVKDGAAIKMLQRAGIKVGFLSGRESSANLIRARELKLDFSIQKCSSKINGIKQLSELIGETPDAFLYIGDDLIDGAAMNLCGIAVAVADAATEIQQLADWTCQHKGGRGAIRETAEWLLKQQGKWQQALAYYGL